MANFKVSIPQLGIVYWGKMSPLFFPEFVKNS